MASRAALMMLLVCLAVAPGCSALSGSPGGDSETLTPVPVTTEDTTPAGGSDDSGESGRLPPGIRSNGTVDVDRLVAAHESFVANRTYRWEFSYGVSGGSGPFTPNFTQTVSVGDERVLVRRTYAGRLGNQTLLVGENDGYLRSVRSRDMQVRTVEEPGTHRSLAFSGQVLERLLTGVTAVDADGQTYYRVHAADAAVPPRVREGTSAVREYAVTAYITPEGFVRSVATSYERIEPRGGGSRVTARYDYTTLGGVTVERPDWAPVPSDLPTDGPPARTTTPSATTPGNGTATDSGAAAADGTRNSNDRTVD